MRTLVQEIRFAGRMLRKTPGFTAVAILTLALGIGANTAAFSLINAVLLHKLPYPQADRLVLLWGNSPSRGQFRSQVSFTDAEDWRQQSSSFEELASFAQWSPILSGDAPAERLGAIQVSDGFFRVLQARPLLGRLFLPEDQVEGRDNVVVLSYQLWQRRFGSDPNIVGRTLRLSANAYTVVGVLPRDFQSLPPTLVRGTTEIYRPAAEQFDEKSRDSRHFRAIARLRPNITVDRAQAEITAIAERIESAHPTSNQGYSVRVVSLYRDLTANSRPALLSFYGAVFFVLLIGCTNVANLLLGRFGARERELAVRMALGASRKRVIGQVMTESLVLSTVGGIAGLALGAVLVRVLSTAATKTFPSMQPAQMDAAVFGYTTIISFLSAIAFGLLPARHVSGTDVNSSLKGNSSTTIGSGRNLRELLVIAETALALALVASAGLLLRSVHHLYRVDPGFNPADLVSADVTLPFSKYGRTLASSQFYHALIDRVQSIPGVQNAGATSTLPLADFDTVSIETEGHPMEGGLRPSVDRYIVTPECTSTMQIKLISGRYLSGHDTESNQPVAMINQMAARQLWPGENVLGKRVRLPGKDEPWREIIGVVRDVKQYALDKPDTLQLYLPDAQYFSNYMTLVVHSTMPVNDLVGRIRAEMQQLGPDAALSAPVSLDDLFSASLGERKTLMLLLAGFATIALLLSAVGVYGVYSFMIGQRGREVALRISLGAPRRSVLLLLMKSGFRSLSIGAVVGLGLTTLASRLLASFLYATKPLELTVLAASIVVLATVALAATFIPARRWSRVDPMIIMRGQ